MKTITIEELKNIIENGAWTHTHEVEYIDSHIETVVDGDDRTYVYGSGALISRYGDIKVTHFEGYSYYSGEPGTFTSSSEGLDEVWKIEGIQVIDHEGEPAHISDFYNIFDDNFPSIDYSSLISSIDSTFLVVDTESGVFLRRYPTTF